MESIAPLAALRPQPFGLPLRGRAPHSEGGNRSRRWQPVIDHKKMGADSLLILPLSGRRMGGSAPRASAAARIVIPHIVPNVVIHLFGNIICRVVISIRRRTGILGRSVVPAVPAAPAALGRPSRS